MSAKQALETMINDETWKCTYTALADTAMLYLVERLEVIEGTRQTVH
jgi:hypothetical protein